MKISIVIPIYQEARTIGLLADALVGDPGPHALELVLVNDGSTDDSHAVCLALLKKYPGKVKYIQLSRNFGEWNAVMAGLNHAAGDYTVIMDADLQNPPGEVKKLVEKAVEGGFDVVYSYFAKKRHSFLRNLGSKFHDLTANCLLNKPKDLYLCTFRCMNRFIVKEVIKYKGPFPDIDGLIWQNTRNIGKVLVRHERRQEGKASNNFPRLIRLWMNLLVHYPLIPLRVSGAFGLISLALTGAAAIFIGAGKDAGFTTLILMVVWAFLGIVLLMLGVIGEYLGTLLMTVNNTPQYVIRSVFDQDPPKGR